MKYLDAYRLIKENIHLPIFCVKIGICSPQVVGVSFEEALAEFDRCSEFFGDFEYPFIYCIDYHKDSELLNEAIRMFVNERE